MNEISNNEAEFEKRNIDFETQPPEIDYEVRMEGDVIIIHTAGLTDNDKLKLARLVQKNLGYDAIERESDFEYFITERNEWRPHGNFCIQMFQNDLMIDNRNGRGNKEYQERIKQAVDLALAEFHEE